ncbi:Flp pilus assembly protein CpaB [uncultured Albimonas sp.]|uniref:Flp pilus assembly protein CpaB n=1 Tax=uncultured Albimonas sp. TaxID=1331701 RepID=UPI0030EE9779
MRSLAVFIFVAGLALAGGAAWYVFAKVQAAEARAGDPVATVPVAVANKDLKFGQPLTKADVRVVRFPADAVPENAFTSPTELFGEGEDVKPRTVLRRMEPSELILKSKITGFGQRATVATLIEPGMRAYTLPVDAASAVGGFLLPGSRVDIILTTKDRAGPTARVLIQNIEIVAVDQDTDPDRIEAKIAKTVTVQGTPEQVQALTLASSVGSLSLSLRGFGGEAVNDAGVLDRNALLGVVEEAPASEPEPVEAAPEPEPEVRVIVRRGSQVEVKTMH